ncbi:12727_t:CDS:2, partial [Funneliformis caledonium]
FNAKNEEFSSLLKWNTYPEATKVLKQLELCYDCTPSKRPPNFKEVCNAIYEYMNKMFRASDGVFELVKESLENKPWILCGKTFYCADQIVFKLPHQSNLNSNDFLIVEFPAEYPNKLEPFFKAMGVRDVIGVKDFILIITNKSKGNLDRELSTDEIEDIVQILEQIATIQQDAREGRKYLEKLDGLLVPSTKNKLVNYDEIQYDDMKDRIDEREKSKYQIAHQLITREVVKELGIETLTGKIYGHGSDDINWDIYEQDESLTTRIKNIIKDYPLEKLFIEFLQNADDAKAKRFSIIIDKRPKLQHDCSKKTLLSDEMDDWQGPSIWIYNDAEFSDHDFMALIKLGVGGKSHDNTKIGRFGIGFNSSFHVTDLPSIVSGKYIAFLDPNAKFLPTKKHRGTRFNFIEKEFKKRIPDQCFPYKALEGCDFIKDCSFTKEFKGTLFRLPLRTPKLAEMSDISNRVIDINEIVNLFSNVQGSKEMLFLRNIESCSMYRIDENGQAPQMIWQTQINNMSETIRDIRKSVIVQEQTYKLEIERTNEQNQKSSEIWLLCTGEHESVKSEFENFSNEKRLKPRGGVAALLAKSDEKCLDELKAES